MPTGCTEDPNHMECTAGKLVPGTGKVDCKTLCGGGGGGGGSSQPNVDVDVTVDCVDAILGTGRKTFGHFTAKELCTGITVARDKKLLPTVAAFVAFEADKFRKLVVAWTY